MRIEKKVILMGAAVAAMPMLAQAGTVTYQYSTATILLSPTSTGTFGAVSGITGASLTGTGANEVLTVPQGTFVQFGLQAEQTNPSDGIFSFDIGITDSNAGAAQILATSAAAGTALASPKINSVYSGAKTFGVTDGAGGVSSASTGGIFGGFNTQNATPAQGANGAGAFANLFTAEKISTAAGGGTSIFTPVQINGGTGLITQAPSATTVSYTSKAFTAGVDTISAMPTLKIIVVPTGGGTTHSIISLTQGTVPVTGYLPADGVIAMTGAGHGSYNVTPATGFVTATTGSVLVSGFNPATDQEIYALKLSQNGTPISPTNSTLLSAIASDINGGNGNVASAGVSASLIGGVFASLFPGYDLLITSTGAQPADAGGNAVLGFDFSSGGGEVNAADAGITVTGVAAVPEPATAAGVVLGAAGLLLGRRKNRMTVAA